MTIWWWLTVLACWSLIPAALLLKAELDKRAAQSERELQRHLKEIFRSAAERKDA